MLRLFYYHSVGKASNGWVAMLSQHSRPMHISPAGLCRSSKEESLYRSGFQKPSIHGNLPSHLTSTSAGCSQNARLISNLVSPRCFSVRTVSRNVMKPTVLLETMLLFGALVDPTSAVLGKWPHPSSFTFLAGCSSCKCWPPGATLEVRREPQAGVARNEFITLISLYFLRSPPLYGQRSWRFT